MSKLDELIAELCPDGMESVKWMKLGDVAILKAGKAISASNINAYQNEDYPYMCYGGNGCRGYVKKANQKGEYPIIGRQGALCGNVIYARDEFYATEHAVVVSCNDLWLPRFAFYILTAMNLNQYKSAGAQPGLSVSNLVELQVPGPPLPIQQEIVRILDSFTEYKAELETELEARKKQYEYYRNSLLSFEGDESVKWMKLGDIGDVTKLAGFEFTKYVSYSDTGTIIALRGLNVKNGTLVLDDVKYIDDSDFSKLNRSKLIINDMLFTYVGTVGQVALVDVNDKYYLAPNVARIRLNDKAVYPKFVLYYLQCGNFVNGQMNKLMASSSMKNLTMEKIRKFEIPVPTLDKQHQIADILDRFDALCNDITTGIPAEIAARQKQYEYYRDKLLTFKEKEA